MEPVKLYINCHGHECQQPKKLKTPHRMAGAARLQGRNYENVEGASKAAHGQDLEAPAIPERPHLVGSSKAIRILFILLGVSVLLWGALAALGFIYYTNVHKEKNLEVMRLWTAIQNLNVPNSTQQADQDKVKRLSEALKNMCDFLQCPEGWHKFQNKCYCFSNRLPTRDANEYSCNVARKYCANQRSALVIIDGILEQEFLEKNARCNSWIGSTEKLEKIKRTNSSDVALSDLPRSGLQKSPSGSCELLRPSVKCGSYHLICELPLPCEGL